MISVSGLFHEVQSMSMRTGIEFNWWYPIYALNTHVYKIILLTY